MRAMFGIFAFLLIAAAPLANEPLPDPDQERTAQALMQELRCLVCQHQSIVDSDAEMAGDMRALVREQIAAGEEPQAIKAYLISRYGEWVTFNPPKTGVNLLLWAAPALFLLIGGFLAWRMFKRQRS